MWNNNWTAEFSACFFVIFSDGFGTATSAVKTSAVWVVNRTSNPSLLQNLGFFLTSSNRDNSVDFRFSTIAFFFRRSSFLQSFINLSVFFSTFFISFLIESSFQLANSVFSLCKHSGMKFKHRLNNRLYLIAVPFMSVDCSSISFSNSDCFMKSHSLICWASPQSFSRRHSMHISL